MAPKISPLLSYALFLFLSLIFSHAKSTEAAIKDIPSSSSFGFIKSLQGSKKGDKVKGIYNLKNYLKTFGYIDELSYDSNSPEADGFSDQLEFAVRTYQTNFNLNSTGVLDVATVSQMMKPRCGVPDIINVTNWMQRHVKPFKAVPNYSFFPGEPKWPDDKNVLSYGWPFGTPSKFDNPTHMAFIQWTGWTRFTFSKTDHESADLKFHLFAGKHGDCEPFDGRGGILAHAFAPTDGICHFDSDENWVEYGPTPYGLHIQTVAMHEIGHLLGLGHSGVRDAVMYPEIEYGEKKTVLAMDDINGLEAIYNH